MPAWLPMKPGQTPRAVAGVVLFAVGLLSALPTPYRERTFVFQAGGCHLDTGVIESKQGPSEGAVLLLHGLAANKKIMSYLARGFAAQGLRVIVPDLPGHGRTPGPFSPERAEVCVAALLDDLVARGMATPATTVLAGHSMGGAIALRLAEKFPVLAVVAISPAPMRPAHGANPEALLLEGPPTALHNALVFSGQFEMNALRANAADLVSAPSTTNSRFLVIPFATHVSVLFDPRVAGPSQQWVKGLLNLTLTAPLPSHRALLASLAGFLGLLLIAGPFLLEVAKSHPTREVPFPASPAFLKAALSVALASAASVTLLHWGNPLRSLGLFEADYFAAFLILAAMILLAIYRPTPLASLGFSASSLWRSAFAALMLVLLINGWFELTLSEAWLNAARWARFPFFLALVFPFHLAEELLLGGLAKLAGWRRLAAAMTFRLIAWLAIVVALYHLHSGAILLLLLAPFFVLLSLLQRRGMDLVRHGTSSPAAAALFGAILLAGFCLVIFPIT
jgi:pimeloyl-ACP methyl ester carboxylesterase